MQNVLELKVCDEDTVTRDDELCTVLFDIDKLTIGRTVRVKFQLNPQVSNGMGENKSIFTPSFSVDPFTEFHYRKYLFKLYFAAILRKTSVSAFS